MNNQSIKDFNVGEKAYVVYSNIGYRQPPRMEEVTITKVGRKYITANNCEYYYDDCQNKFIPKENYATNILLYSSKILAEEEITRLLLKPKISNIIRNKINSFSNDDIKAIYEIVKNMKRVKIKNKNYWRSKKMREILFRGKRIDNGEWITGGIFQQKADDVKDEVVYIIDNSSNDVDWAHRVIPETVGQFTGVTDKKGNRVFEGSIFRYEPHFTTEKACLGIVKYRNTYDRQRACNDCGFVIEWQHEPLLMLREDLLYWCGDGKSASVIGNIHDMNGSDIEVIDNIHDNPKALRCKNDLKG